MARDPPFKGAIPMAREAWKRLDVARLTWRQIRLAAGLASAIGVFYYGPPRPGLGLAHAGP